MRRILHSSSFKILVIVLAALLVGSSVSAVSHSGSSPLTTVTGAVFGPVQRFAAFSASKLSSLPFSFRSSSVLNSELEESRKEAEKLREQLVDYEKLKKENELYQTFFDLKKENPDQKYCEASIIGKDSGSYLSSFTLNKGSTSGISVQDPVIYGNNLVGVVSSVGLTSCTVKTILNPDVNVSCYEIRTATLGYTTTTVELAEKGFCHMPNLPADTSVTDGGIVCTSGVSGVYPADLIIGTIYDIVDATVDISAAAIIKPAVDPDSLTAVFVITEFAGQGVTE